MHATVINSFNRYWATIRHLKPIQLQYQLYYRVRKSVVGRRYPENGMVPEAAGAVIPIADWIPAHTCYKRGTFTFLNRSKKFEASIDWNFQQYGLLWNYNLNYFDYLLQPGMDKVTGLSLMDHFIANIESNESGLDPYPISLRVMNWIKFCLQYSVDRQNVSSSLYRQLQVLQNNLEYHLLGNHLLENAFALLLGGLYFSDKKLLNKAQTMLEEQLREQLCNDGGHFERSPMYHRILLTRLLDCYNLAQNHPLITDGFIDLLKCKSEQMLGWLANVTFSDGTTPNVNDAAEGIAPNCSNIFDYADRLDIAAADISLGDSGYRMIQGSNYEWFLDVGDVGPDYIPGHAHSDTFSFVLMANGTPLVVDTGTSTYEACMRRMDERLTAAHNTVSVNGVEQTDVWEAFRVGRRAKITTLQLQEDFITAEHDGYQHLGIRHRRTFRWHADGLLIEDEVKGAKDVASKACIHFHPGVSITKEGEIIIADGVRFRIKYAHKVEVQPYQYAAGFNNLKAAQKLEITFDRKLETRIEL